MAFGSGNSTTLTVFLKANTQEFQKSFNQASGVVKSFEKTLNSAIGATKGTLQALQFPTNFNDAVQLSIQKFTEFDAAMRNINSIAKMNDQEYQQFSNTIMHMNDTLHSAVGPAEAARAAYEILSSGFEDTAEAQKVLEASMIAGTAGLSDAMSAAKLFSGILNAYNMDAEEVGHVSDVMFNTVKYGTATFEQLARTFARVTPTAAANKISLEELSAAVATLTVKGIRTNEAVTGIKRAITAVAAPTQQAQKTLKEYGLTAKILSDTIARDGLVPALKLLLQATGENKRALRELLGESTAINSAFALAGSGSGMMFDKINSHIGEAGSTMDAFLEQSKSLNLQIAQLKTSIEAAGITIGGVFAPGISSAIDVMKQFLNGIVNMGTNWNSFLTSIEKGTMDWKTFGLAITGVTVLLGPLALAAGGAAGGIGTLGGALAGFAVVVESALVSLGGLLASALALPAAILLGAAAFAKYTSEMERSNAAAEQQLKTGVELERNLKGLNDIRFRGGEFKGSADRALKFSTNLILLQTELNQANEELSKFDKNIENLVESGHDKEFLLKETADARKEIVNRIEFKKKALQEERDLQQKSFDEEKLAGDERAAKAAQQRAQQAIDNKEYFRELKQFEEDFADSQFKSKAEALAKAEELEKKYRTKYFQAAFNGDETIVAAYEAHVRKLKELKVKAAQEEAKFLEAFHKTVYERELKGLEASKNLGNIEYKDYIAKLRKMQQEHKAYGNMGVIIEAKIAMESKKHREQEEKDREKRLTEYMNKHVKNLEKRRKDNEISFAQEAKALDKLAKDQRLSETQRANLAEKAAQMRQNQREKDRKHADTEKKIEIDLQKEKIEDAKEELDFMKQKVMAGVTTEGAYTEAVKKTYEMKKKTLELERDRELNRKDLDEDDKAMIQKKFEMELKQLQKETANSYISNMQEIDEAKKNMIARTEEQIQKEKEYQNLIKNEGKGAIMTLDEMIQSMNTRWNSGEFGPMSAGQANDRFSGEGSLRDKLKKERDKKFKAGNKLGFNNDELWNQDPFGSGKNSKQFWEDKWASFGAKPSSWAERNKADKGADGPQTVKELKDLNNKMVTLIDKFGKRTLSITSKEKGKGKNGTMPDGYIGF